MKHPAIRAFLFTAVLLLAGYVHADHPGEELDKRLTEREKYFQAVDKPAPPFELADAESNPITLSDFADKIVILNFIYARCPHVCPIHADKIADVQSLLNQSAMKDLVRFVTVTTDPANDTPAVLKSYGGQHGLDPSNWQFLTKREGQPNDATRQLARGYGLEFTQTEDNLQMHGVVTFVIDRKGRLAAKFHGLDFDPLNMVLYVNGLTNKISSLDTQQEPTWWETLQAVFE